MSCRSAAKTSTPVLEALDRHRKFIRGEIAQAVDSARGPRGPLPRGRDLRGSEPHRPASAQRQGSSRRGERLSTTMARRKKGNPVHGWVVLDKPLGMTSTRAVGVLRRLFVAQKVGHAGTLDPLATGILPIALGEATKTVPFAVDGEKVYRFTVRWGAETTTDDAEGERGREEPREPSDSARRSRRCCRASPARSCRCRRLLGHQGRGRAGLRSRARRRGGGPRAAAGADRRPVSARVRRCRHGRVRGALRQGDLCARARTRHGAGARGSRPCHRAAADVGRAVQRA